jgi:hypothetical protein
MLHMKTPHFIQKIVQILRGEPELSDAALYRLVSRLEATREDELSCDEVFALVDDYAEACQRGKDVAHLKPLIRRHLDMCRECEEEYEALLRVLEATPEDE